VLTGKEREARRLYNLGWRRKNRAHYRKQRREYMRRWCKENPGEHYRRNNKPWRLRHPDKRHVQKARYYAKHRKQAGMARTRWQDWERNLVMTRRFDNFTNLNDVAISKIIRRAVSAIQAMRHTLKKLAWK